MKICVIGIGYVGLCLTGCLAEIGHEIYCIDKDENKIEKLKHGIMPFFEPKLKDLIEKNKNKLSFSNKLKDGLEKADICFLAINTPTKENGEVDTKSIFEIADEISKNIKKYTLIINKSTVPIGFNKILTKYMKNKTAIDFDIVSNPEFLSQGSAVDNFMHPERIIIGTNSNKAKEIVKKIYKPLEIDENKVIFMDENSAEMVKYAANSFLALKISYMNEIAKLCEKTGANIEDVKKGISADSRIGDKFLNCGIGYGGSCFPKDTKAIVEMAKRYDLQLNTIQSAMEVNDKQIDYFVEKIISHYNGRITNINFAILGISFKPNTNDIREAPSIKIIDKLVKMGACVKAFDPKVNYKNYSVLSIDEALINANALIIATEWDEFKNLSIDQLKKIKDKVIFDGRNIFLNRNLEKYGINYYYIGKYE